MPRLTVEKINEILPVLLKDVKARNDPAFILWQESRTDVQSMGPKVRVHAERIVSNPYSRLTPGERQRLLEFVAEYPPGPNAGKAEDPLTARVQFKVSDQQKLDIIREAAIDGLEYTVWARQVIMAAVAQRKKARHGETRSR